MSLSSLLLLLPFNNLSTPIISSHNFFCFHFESKYNVLFCHFVIISLFIAKIKRFLQQRVKKKITLTNSYFSKIFSKDSSFASISIYFQIIMPYFGLPRAFFFKKSNIINFLDSYSRIYTNYQVNK